MKSRICTVAQLNPSALLPGEHSGGLRPIREVLSGLPLALQAAERLADPEWHPTPEQVAQAQHALAQAPCCPQSNLFGIAPK